MNIILIVIQIIASVALIGLILMQQGKGADAGASFGAGASQTFFGSAGSANAMTKLTAVFAAIFFAASLGLAYVAQEEDKTGLQKDLSEQLEGLTAPAAGDAANSGLAPAAAVPESSENSDLAPAAPSQDLNPEASAEVVHEAAQAVEPEAQSNSAESLPVPKSTDQ